MKTPSVSFIINRNRPMGTIHRDQLAILDTLGGYTRSQHGRDAVLAGHDRAVRQRPADIGDDAGRPGETGASRPGW